MPWPAFDKIMKLSPRYTGERQGTQLSDSLRETWNRNKADHKRLKDKVQRQQWWEALTVLNQLDHPWWQKQALPLRTQVEEAIQNLLDRQEHHGGTPTLRARRLLRARGVPVAPEEIKKVRGMERAARTAAGRGEKKVVEAEVPVSPVKAERAAKADYRTIRERGLALEAQLANPPATGPPAPPPERVARREDLGRSWTRNFGA